MTDAGHALLDLHHRFTGCVQGNFDFAKPAWLLALHATVTCRACLG